MRYAKNSGHITPTAMMVMNVVETTAGMYAYVRTSFTVKRLAITRNEYNKIIYSIFKSKKEQNRTHKLRHGYERHVR